VNDTRADDDGPRRDNSGSRDRPPNSDCPRRRYTDDARRDDDGPWSDDDGPWSNDSAAWSNDSGPWCDDCGTRDRAHDRHAIWRRRTARAGVLIGARGRGSAESECQCCGNC